MTEHQSGALTWKEVHLREWKTKDGVWYKQMEDANIDRERKDRPKIYEIRCEDETKRRCRDG